MQFHVEQESQKMETWIAGWDAAEQQADARWPSVQDAQAMRTGAARHLAAQHALADRIYSRWLGLAQAR